MFCLFFIISLYCAVKYVFFNTSNNYSIFYHSLQHLVNGESLYTSYPDVYFDHFLYAPAFPVIFAPIFLLPYKAGLFLWPFLFAFIWAYGVYKMPWDGKQKVFAWWFGIQELLTSLDNSQTNPLIAAIPLFAFICMEKGKVFWAAFFIILGFNVKIYSLVAAALFVVYPGRIRFLGSLLFWATAFAILPLLATSPAKLVWQYKLWIEELFTKTDHDRIKNVSIHRMVFQFISTRISPFQVISFGVLLFCSVFIHKKRFNQEIFKMLLLSSILIFHVIFHPAAESATYITAVTGVIVWWLYGPRNKIDWFLVLFCYLFTIMGPTDLMPRYVRKQLIEPYVLKALPCVLIWFRVIYLMHFPGKETRPTISPVKL